MKKLLATILLLSPLYCFADEAVSCAYVDVKSNVMAPTKDCGTLKDDGRILINQIILDKTSWGQYGLACMSIYNTKERKRNGWYFINQSGKGRISAFSSDNNCKAFSEGVAVGISKGKVYFYNQVMDVVKRTHYTWTSSFYKGFAKVCRKYDSTSEHHVHKRGQCGFIDTAFNEVVEAKHPYENTPEPIKTK